jgi:hypothetical protein
MEKGTDQKRQGHSPEFTILTVVIQLKVLLSQRTTGAGGVL